MSSPPRSRIWGDIRRLDDMPPDSSKTGLEAFGHTNPGLIIVDKDNLDKHATRLEASFSLDQVIDALVQRHTGIDELIGVCVFTTDNGFINRFEAELDDPSRFCIHSYVRELRERGYADDEMYRCAWRHVKHYRTVCYLSHDHGVAEVAAEHRRGYSRFTDASDAKWIREAVVVSPYWGHTDRWRTDADEPVDLDLVLAELGFRAAVNRPA